MISLLNDVIEEVENEASHVPPQIESATIKIYY